MAPRTTREITCAKPTGRTALRPTIGFLPAAVDPGYFAPLEVAFAYHRPFSDEANAEIDQRLQALNFDGRRPILPGSTVSGLVLASHPRPARDVDVNLVGVRWGRDFSMIVARPGERGAGAYAATELVRA